MDNPPDLLQQVTYSNTTLQPTARLARANVTILTISSINSHKNPNDLMTAR